MAGQTPLAASLVAGTGRLAAGGRRSVGRFYGGVEAVAHLVPVLVVWNRRCGCQGWPTLVDVQSRGKNLAWFPGPVAVTQPASSTFLKVLSMILFVGGRLGSKDLLGCFSSVVGQMSISFLKASLEHFCGTPLAGAALSRAAPMRASSFLFALVCSAC